MSGPQGFVLRLPESWTEYDLTGRDLRRAHVRARAQASSVAERAVVDDAYRQAGELMRASVRRGALSASGLIEWHEEGLLLAFLAVFAFRLGDSGDVEQLLGALRQGDGDDRRRLRPVTLHDGVVGAQVSGVERVPVSDEQVEMFTMTTIVPVPEGGDRHLVVTAASPNVAEAAELEELFDVLTGTLRFVALPDEEDVAATSSWSE